MKIALYQPDIAGNVGTIIRMCACLGFDLDIIEPCGFPFDDSRVRRSAMDYYDHVKITKYADFEEFRNEVKNIANTNNNNHINSGNKGINNINITNNTNTINATGVAEIIAAPRIILLTTKASKSLYDFSFRNNDIILTGRESAGVPEEVHAAVDEKIIIPMKPKKRCLNVAISLAMAASWAIGKGENGN